MPSDLPSNIKRALATEGPTEDPTEFGVDLYRILAPPDDDDFVHPILAIVCELECGMTVADWNIDAWPDDKQLMHPHQSIYGSLGDLEQVAEGPIEHLTRVTGR
ncbi:hypothetical protein C440_05642 [Haloferax mucosum ATCC BAA-1512]|uniref:Uncharacterized protein n=1 Tax=Haloferax mucosum ATCC BAA-1512 TaxID=662479 RepID=M0IJN4_9EURY|nr:hypothetical protein [Haloferax mucosum]ELZ96048.1 hypothetical protein C440_05642 [Haloferax mucosum ATCC BAA-1512]